MGVAGIGKSRLVWEFEKYIDGLADDVWWHQRPCLAYGEGVAFWALAEMVRRRAGSLEDEEAAVGVGEARDGDRASTSLTRTSAGSSSRGSRTSSGSRSGGAGDQENLFAAWRIFFERIAEQCPVDLVFEDIHWADSALLDFIEYLVDWSRDHPIFVVDARAAGARRAPPTWGAGTRNFTSIFLEPLPTRGDGRRCSAAPSRGCPTSCGSGSSSAPRASRSTRSRRCGC